jgi:hypothetical protein
MTDPFTDPTDDFLGGDSAPAWKFDSVGDERVGFITGPPNKKIDTDLATGAVRTWDNGDPKHVYVFDLLEADGTPASFWARGNAITAIRAAAKEVGAKSVAGHWLKLKHHDLGKAEKGKHPAKLFEATLKPGTAPARKATTDDSEPF